jgi:hypothetical protein
MLWAKPKWQGERHTGVLCFSPWRVCTASVAYIVLVAFPSIIVAQSPPSGAISNLNV